MWAEVTYDPAEDLYTEDGFDDEGTLEEDDELGYDENELDDLAAVKLYRFCYQLSSLSKSGWNNYKERTILPCFCTVDTDSFSVCFASTWKALYVLIFETIFKSHKR